MFLKFTKMHGTGNDFVVVDCREQDPGRWPDLAPRLAHRRFGQWRLDLRSVSDYAQYWQRSLSGVP